MEVISYLIDSNSPYFLLTDICNTLQGVFIFILFVCNRRVFNLIKKRFVYLIKPDTFSNLSISNLTAIDSTSFLFLDGWVVAINQCRTKRMHRIVSQPVMCDSIIWQQRNSEWITWDSRSIKWLNSHQSQNICKILRYRLNKDLFVSTLFWFIS